MGVSRRDFLKLTGATAVAGAVGGADEAQAARTREPSQRRDEDDQHLPVLRGRLRDARLPEGRQGHPDRGRPRPPDQPGRALPEGRLGDAAREQRQRGSPSRATAPRARREWKEVEWSWALDEIAKRVKKARDASFVEKNDKGQTVNRTNAIASVGSAAMDNEECYLYQKWLRSLGLVAIEHQARI